MTSVFVVLPDSLYCNANVLTEYRFHSQIFICEDPVVFNKESSKTKLVMCRTALKSYQVWLEKVLEIDSPNNGTSQLKKITYVGVNKILEKGPTIFDYFISIGYSLHMWRPNSMWSYGERPYEYTYAGLNVIFVETPAFIIKYRTVRDEFRNPKCSLKTVLNKMADEALDAHVGKLCKEAASNYITGGSDENNAGGINMESIVDNVDNYAQKYISDLFPNMVGKVTMQVTNCTQADKLLNKFIQDILPTYKLGDGYILLPALNIGLLEVARVLRAVALSNVVSECKSLFAQDMALREYRRIIYLSGMEFLIDAPDAIIPAETAFNAAYIENLRLMIIGGKFIPRDSFIDLMSWCVVSGINDETIVSLGKKLPWGFDWNIQVNRGHIVKKYCSFKLSENMPVDSYNVLLTTFKI